MTWHIVIPGDPKGRTDPTAFGYVDANGKPKVRRGQTKTTKSFEAMVAGFAEQALRQVPRIDQSLRLDVLAVFARPGYLDEPWQPDGLIIQANKPDRDNIEKAVQDGLKAIWRDDCLVSVGMTVKAYCERKGKPRTELWLRALGANEVIELHGNRITMPATDADRDVYRLVVKAAKDAERTRVLAERAAEKARLKAEQKPRAKSAPSPTLDL